MTYERGAECVEVPGWYADPLIISGHTLSGCKRKYLLVLISSIHVSIKYRTKYNVQIETKNK